jgi:sulfide:quinone oxidoreductase
VTTRRLREALPDSHHVLLIDKNPKFAIGATKTWVMLGQADPENVSYSLDRLIRKRIDVRRTEVRRIDVSSRSVSTAAGEIRADYLVIALGADLNMSLVPGLEKAAHTFYTMEGAVGLRERLRAFDGGDVVVLIPRTPFKCPPGPYEAAMLLHAYFQERGLGGRTRINVHTIEKLPMATAGPEIGDYVRGELERRGIGYHPLRKVERADPDRKIILFEDGSAVGYDLLIAIPPHEAPAAVRESGLTNQAGWIPVDPTTLELTAPHEARRVYAIGDVASVALPGRFQPDAPLVLPKAGVFAERQAAVVAGAIASHALGRESADRFDGKGFCYIETGGSRALRGDGSFFELPRPLMTPRDPDAGQYAAKKQWVTDWIATYL